MKHTFIDCETLGKNVFDCAVIDFSMYTVDTTKMLSNEPYNLHDITNIKKLKLSVKEQVDKYGWVVYSDTIDFWNSQSAEAKSKIAPKKTDISVEQFVSEFTGYLINSGRVDYWWSRSNAFDPLIIWRIYNACNKYDVLNSHLPHWKIRDIRTFIDAKLDFPKKNGFIPLKDEVKWKNTFIEHDSAWDVLADVLRMQAILRAENDMEQV